MRPSAGRAGVVRPQGLPKMTPQASIMPSPKPIIEWTGKGPRPSPYVTPFVLGSGSYGCVIADAVVFKESKAVKVSNRKKYVTKLAVDAEQEYKLASDIQKLVPDDVGVFPVDQLHCGITYRDIGHASRRIAARCEDIFGGLLEKSLYAPKRSKNTPGGRRRSPVPQVCGVQYPRYYADLYKYATEVEHKSMEALEIGAQLAAKLEQMHAKGVLHLDIKGLNACLMQNPHSGVLDARFADWGFAVIGNKAKTLGPVVYRTLTPSFKEYYTRSLLPFHEDAPRLQWQPVYEALIHGTASKKLEALKFIDKWCLVKLVMDMIPWSADARSYAIDSIKSLNAAILRTLG